jgi:hypothetical protein
MKYIEYMIDRNLNLQYSILYSRETIGGTASLPYSPLRNKGTSLRASIRAGSASLNGGLLIGPSCNFHILFLIRQAVGGLYQGQRSLPVFHIHPLSTQTV